MKTPREVILKQHLQAEVKLAAIQANDLAACAREALEPAKAELSATSRRQSIFERFWTEAILPWRRVWMGMATVWMGILALNLAMSEGPTESVNRMIQTDPRAKLVLFEQRQMLAQLLEPMNPPRSFRPTPPGPRSDLRREEVVV